MIYTKYVVKLKGMGNLITVFGIGYIVEKAGGILRIYDRHRHGGEWQQVEVFTAAHGSWEYILKVEEINEQ